MSIITALKDLLPADRIIEGEKLKNRIAHVWHPEWEFKGKLVVIPINTNEVCQIMKLCYSFEQAVIPHGGLTNLVHSTDTSPNDVIISFERMNKVEEIDTTNRTITVQAGAILQNIQNQVRDKNLYFPLDFGARGSCQIGGCISTNAGGLKVIRYGMTRDNVLGLEVVLPDGTILSSLNKMIKNNAGYDLKQLFIGSEGTLGLITRAVIKLKEIPRSFHSAFAGIENFKNLTQFLNFLHQRFAGKLSAFEVFWPNFYRFMTNEKSPFKAPLQREYPFYVLFEMIGISNDMDKTILLEALEEAIEKNLIIDAAPSQSDADQKWFWGIREEVELLISHLPHCFLFDVSLPISNMDQYVQIVQSSLNKHWIQNSLYVFGHAGDGNLHLIISCGKDDSKTRKAVEELVYNPLSQWNGSISAEHGIGTEKKPWLHKSRTTEEIKTMRLLKNAFDPKGILNPGKVI